LALADFISFDEFSIIDAKYLHESPHVYMETPHHLLTLTAYLYSWFGTCLPILHYMHEYILHGTIGYIVYLYLQSIFSEEEATYHMLKSFEAVSMIEKMNYGELPSVAFAYYPEKYETFHPWFGSYLINKSIVVFHVMENRIGSSDPLRMAIQQLLRCPLLTSPTPTQNNINTTSNNNEQQKQQNGNPPLTTYSSHLYHHQQNQQPAVTSAMNSPYYGSNHGNGGFYNSPGLYSIQSPTSIGSSSSTPSYNFMGSPDHHHFLSSSSSSPHHSFSSPNYYNNYYGNNNYNYYNNMGGSTGLGSPSMSSHHSPLFLYGGEQHFFPSSAIGTTCATGVTSGIVTSSVTHDPFFSLTRDCLTGESFLQEVKHFTGVSSDLNDDILEELIYVMNENVIMLKLDLELDKVDAKPRFIHMLMDQIGHHKVSYLISFIC
jgi:hypothetical protein